MRLRALLARRRILPLVALALVAGACVNPFKPADPEPPDSSGVIEDFSTPQEVLNTMGVALQTRSTNGANAYLHAFAESTITGDLAFRAFQDPAVKTVWQGSTQQTPPEPWNVDLERNVHTYLSGLRPSDDYTWIFSDRDLDGTELPHSDEDYTAADTVLWYRLYALEAREKDNPDDSPDTLAIGYAFLSFEKKDGRWFLFRWIDQFQPDYGVVPRNSDHRSMTWLRLQSLVN
jgi:hypothetical protein